MGNKSSKKKDVCDHGHGLDRKRVYDAQDSFVRKIIDKADETNDDDSVGPGNTLTHSL